MKRIIPLILILLIAALLAYAQPMNVTAFDSPGVTPIRPTPTGWHVDPVTGIGTPPAAAKVKAVFLADAPTIAPTVTAVSRAITMIRIYEQVKSKSDYILKGR